jgi:transposase
MKLTSQQFKKYFNEAQGKFEFKRMLAVNLFVIEKKPAKEISKIVNSPPGSIYNWTYLYSKFGIDGILSKKKGGRRSETMSVENEKKFLEKITNDAINGLIITAKSIKQKLENSLSKVVSRTYTYDLLKRNKWRKVAPRPCNPKTSKEIQENFKKDFPKLVAEVVSTFAPNDNRPVKVLFQDEGIFGRINELKNCWAPIGIRPIVKFQLVRQFDYVFATVCPGSGETFSLILPDADSQMMNLFLDELSKHYSNFRIVMVADQAPWHKSNLLKSYDNVRFLHIPAASPELNPAEHLWDHVRENFISNRIFDSLEELETVLEGAFKYVYYHPDSIKSLVSFSWIN